MQEKKQKFAALYCRLSRDDGGDVESNSIGNQKELLIRYARENDYPLTKIFVDDGFSGTTFQRPGWIELMEEVDAGNVCAIIMKDMSRFGRDYLRVGLYMERFADENIRLIAVNDGVDTSKGVDDFTPFRNIMSEWYARDISKKIKASMRTKALSGKHLTGFPVYGYKQDPDDRHRWVVDEIAAEVVKEIYSLCLLGHGPNQIENILNERGIESPMSHQRKNGINNRGKNAFWGAGMVAKILGRIEYCGHTACCKTYHKTYRDKRSYNLPKEEWIITKNTHAEIIDEDTWERVQKLREGTKRKQTFMGDMGALNGILYCFDCGKRLRIQRDVKTKHQYYVCSTYASSRTGHRECTIHSAPRHMVEPAVLSEIQHITEFARENETEFVKLVEKAHEKTSRSELSSAKKELEKSKRRVSELEIIIKRLYEDSVLNRITDEHFDRFYGGYNDEQSALNRRVAELSAFLESEQEKNSNITRFLALVHKYTDTSELTAEIVRVFVEKIMVHQANGKHGKNRRQQLDIYWNYIGAIE